MVELQLRVASIKYCASSCRSNLEVIGYSIATLIRGTDDSPMIELLEKKSCYSGDAMTQKHPSVEKQTFALAGTRDGLVKRTRRKTSAAVYPPTVPHLNFWGDRLKHHQHHENDRGDETSTKRKGRSEHSLYREEGMKVRGDSGPIGTQQGAQMLLPGRKDCMSVMVTLSCLFLVLQIAADLPIKADGFSLQPLLRHPTLPRGGFVGSFSFPQSRAIRGDDTDDDDDDGSSDLAEPEEAVSKAQPPLDNTERAWRYAKRPLLSIGSKGATATHGNSLRELLEAHTVVKVKVNTRPFEGSLEEAFKALRDLAEESGSIKGIELVRTRDSHKTILFGMPGTVERIREGSFPPIVEIKSDAERASNNDESIEK
jgi:RNA-binding protein YhbY